MSFPLFVGPPLYLLMGLASCWRCGQEQSVVALASPDVWDDDSGDAEEEDPSSESDESMPFVLENLTEIPELVLAYVTAANPNYRLHFSQTMQSAYYANVCECGANFGDHFLHGEPGGTFFPTDPAEAAKITITQLPVNEELAFRGTWSLGGGDFIFAHGTWR